MAAEFLRSYGIDIDAEMERIQFGVNNASNHDQNRLTIRNVSLPGRNPDETWDVHVKGNRIEEITEHANRQLTSHRSIDGHGALLAPSLCHPHIHLDKAFLLSHPKYADLQIQQGDFQEAVRLTEIAKARFQHEDLMERGQRVIDESVAAGVTHMRAFVEVDAGVQMKCLEAGIALKKKSAADHDCVVQLCAFAQLPLFSWSKDDEAGEVIRGLIRKAAAIDAIGAIGSTPYVESGMDRMKQNVEWMVDLSIELNQNLDFHLDYNLEPDEEPLVWHVIQTLKAKNWKERTSNRTIVLGHCTRLTLFDPDSWRRLAREIQEADLPISFVGLPTSDLFMMRSGKQPEVRGTLDVPRLVKDFGLNAVFGVNNIGNAFTPYGSCDPLFVACQCVGVYQTGSKRDADLLYECVSTRAKAAIGFGTLQGSRSGLRVDVNHDSGLLLFGNDSHSWRTRGSVSDVVYLYDNCHKRTAIFDEFSIR